MQCKSGAVFLDLVADADRSNFANVADVHQHASEMAADLLLSDSRQVCLDVEGVVFTQLLTLDAPQELDFGTLPEYAYVVTLSCHLA